MSYEVHWGPGLAEAIAHRYPFERSVGGDPSEHDFVAGPLAVALVAFREFDELPEEAGSAVRSYHTIHPFFGALVFIGVLTSPGVVEIASFDEDPDYWEEGDDPDA